MRGGVVSVTKNGHFCFRSVKQLPGIAIAAVPPLNVSPDVPHFLYANAGLVPGIRKRPLRYTNCQILGLPIIITYVLNY